MGGGAWPFLVGGVICLVDSVNERDVWCVLQVVRIFFNGLFLMRQCGFTTWKLNAITGL